jgi:hypothetical protein
MNSYIGIVATQCSLGTWFVSGICVDTLHKGDTENNNKNNNNNNRSGNTRRQKCCAKEAEKKLKYKSLCIEIQRMWNLKCTIIPVIIGATGILTRSLRKNLEAVPGKHSIDSLQKTAVLGTSHIIRKVLQCEA